MKSWLKPALFVSSAIVTGVLIGAIWWNWPRTAHFYTDTATIHEEKAAAAPRTVLWQPPRPLSELINTADEDYEARVSWDGLTLYFVRGRAGGAADIFICTKSPEGWSAPEPLVALNSEFDDLGPEPTRDGSAIYFYSNRPGGSGGYDLWVSRRGEDDWQPPINLGPAVNTQFNDYGPALSPDGTRLYFASNRPVEEDEKAAAARDAWPATVREDFYRRPYDLYVSEITDLQVASPRYMAELNTPANEGAPCVSPAGDFLYFASDRTGGQGGFDLFRTRLISGTPQPPESLGAAVNTSANELDPGLDGLGFALFFSSDRPAEGETTSADDPYNLYYTCSREVFLDSEARRRSPIDWAALWAAIWPHLLWLLPLLLLTLLLLAFLKDMKNRRLNLLTRCLLASLLLHLLLLSALGLWRVSAAVMSAVKRDGRQIVSLVAPTQSDALAQQVRAAAADPPDVQAAEIETQRVETQFDPAVAMRAVEVSVDRAQLIEEPYADRAPELTVEARAPEFTPPSTRAPSPTPQKPPEIAIRTPTESLQQSAQEVVEAAAIEPRPTTPDRAAQEITPAQFRANQPFAALAPERRDPNQPTRMPVTQMNVADAPLEKQPATRVATAPTAPPSAPAMAFATPQDVERKQNAPDSARAAFPTPAAAPPLRAEARIEQRRDTRAIEIAADVAKPQEFMLAAAIEPAGRELDARRIAPVTAERADLRAALVPVAAPLPDFRVPLSEVRAPQPENRAAVQEPVVAASDPTPVRPSLEDLKTTPVRASLDHLVPPPNVTPPIFAAPSRLPVATPAESETVVSVSPTTISRDERPTEPRLRVALPVDLAPQREDLAQRMPEARRRFLERLGGDEETEAAVARALRWLARHQSADGMWDPVHFDDACGECAKEPPGPSATAATTALALLAFLGAGHTHTTTGPYQDNVEHAIAWLVNHEMRDGDARCEENMYTQAMVTLALAEAYTMTRDSRLAMPTARAAEFLVNSQSRRDGGWGSQPNRNSETPMTAWAVAAIHAVRTANLPVDAAALVAAREWLDAAESPTSPGRYGDRSGRRPNDAATAEAAFIHEFTGTPLADPALAPSFAAIAANVPQGELPDTRRWHWTTLALFHHGGEEWAKWNAAMKPALLATQATRGPAAGSWAPVDAPQVISGRVYQTAISTLMLEVYYRHVPAHAINPTAPHHEIPPDAIGAIRGRIVDASTGDPLPGARVRLDLPDQPARIVESDASGEYVLDVPTVPEFFAISVTAEGYIPVSANIPSSELRGSVLTRDFALHPQRDNVITMEAEPVVHHLGNDRFEGAINSQFQRESEGDAYIVTFEVAESQLSADWSRARVVLLAKGVQCPHRISLNGRILRGKLSETPEDGSFGPLAIRFDPSWLESGTNTLEINAVACRGDLDDFEFVNLQIELEP